MERFWSKVNKTDECWLWTRGRTKQGYGTFSLDGKTHNAHRLAWLFTYGDPGELQVLHRCDNPPCVRPDHLFLGTVADNMKDRDAKGRNGHLGKRSVICRKGLHVKAPTERTCRICKNERQRIWNLTNRSR